MLSLKEVEVRRESWENCVLSRSPRVVSESSNSLTVKLAVKVSFFCKYKLSYCG